MFVLFMLTAFATLLLVSLDGAPAQADRVWRRFRHGALGLTALATGTALTLFALPTDLQSSLTSCSVAWAQESPEATVATESNDTEPSEVESQADDADESTAPVADTAEQSTDKPDAREADVATDATVEVAPQDTGEVVTESDDTTSSESVLEQASDPTEGVDPVSRPVPIDDLQLGDPANYPNVTIPYESRPQWVRLEEDLTGDVHLLPITAGPYEKKSECMKALDEEIASVMTDYIKSHLDSPRAPLFIRYDVDELKQRLLADDHVHDETIEVSFGQMHQVHALLEVNPEFRAELDQNWKDVQAGVRLSQTGLGAFGILGLLAVVFGYFKLDTATRGFYSTRLQILASLAILSLIAAGVLFYGWIPQL